MKSPSSPQHKLLAHLLVSVVAAAPGASAQTEDKDAASWTKCADALEWFVRVDTPNTEVELMTLVQTQALAKHSETWIRAALEQQPGPGAWLQEAQRTAKPILWWVTAVEGQHMILPHLLDRYVEIGMFCDPQLAALVQRRFVPIKCPAGGQLADDFELGTPEFMQPGFVVIAPSGEILAKLDRHALFQAEPFAGFLRELLDEFDEPQRSSAFRESKKRWEAVQDVTAGLEFAHQALLEGELDLARQTLLTLKQADREAEGVLIALARLERVERDASAARAWLGAAADSEPSAAAQAEIALERGLLAVRTGDLASARSELRAAFVDQCPRAAEAGYYLGATLYLSQDEQGAVETWREVARRYPNSLWAHRSHAYTVSGTDSLRGEGPLTRAMESLSWTAPITVDHGARGPLPVSAQSDVIARAVRFLLQQQRSNGSWLGSRWGGIGEPAPPEPLGEGPGLFANIHTAISALACTALLEHRRSVPEERERIDAALERGEQYLMRDDLVQRGMTTAWVYADGFRLMYFARRYPNADERPALVTDEMQTWVGHLVAQQAETGGPFRHFTYTSTFVTAMILLTLDEARSVGIDMPDSVYAGAARVLKGTRDGDDGLFGYLVDHPQVNRTPAGAACRQPLCTLALLRCGATDRADVAAALETFCDNYRASVEPPRKSNFHMLDVAGSAGYFFFHNFFASALAVRELGPEAKEYRMRLLEELLQLPEVDGTFIDSGFSYGKSYSTAVALLSFAALGA